MSWTPFRLGNGATGYNMPDPKKPGNYLYKGPDGKIYSDPYKGEVRPGDIGKDLTNQTSQQAAAQPGSGTGAPGSQTSTSLTPTLQSTLQPTYEQAPPTLQAATYGGTTVAPAATLSGSLLASMNPDATIAQIQKGFAPQAAQQQKNLQDTLAAAGVSGGPAAQANMQLSNSIAAGEAPALASAIQNAQANLLSGNEFNASATNQNNLAQAGYNQQTGLANMTATNDANAANLSDIMSVNNTNTGLANNANNNLLNLIMSGFNTNQQNFNALNTAGFGGASGAANTAQQGSNNLAYNAAGNYPIQSGTAGAFGNLGSALGSYYAPQPGQASLPSGIANYQNLTGGDYGGGANGGVYNPYASPT